MSNRTHPAPGPAAASPVVAEHVPVLLLALLGVLGQLPHALAADLLVAGPPEEPHLLLVLTRLQGALSRGDALELKSRQDQPGTHGEGRRVESQAPRSSLTCGSHAGTRKAAPCRPPAQPRRGQTLLSSCTWARPFPTGRVCGTFRRSVCLNRGEEETLASGG